MAPNICLLFTVFLSILLEVASGNFQARSRRFIVNSNYQWGPWSAYSDCDDCTRGTKSRQRYCHDGKYNNVHGGYCHGYAQEFTACEASDCTHTNVCEDISTACNQYSTYCHPSYVDWAKINCRKTCGYCTTTGGVNGGWSTWSDFSACTVTCGQGQKKRSRTCTNPSPSSGGSQCQGNSEEVYWCILPDCQTQVSSVDGQWSPWSAYSTCSHSCGAGTMTRHRYCNNPTHSASQYVCNGRNTDTQSCIIMDCAVDGGWSLWSGWSSCSSTCGLGVISRDRLCNNPVPSGNGKSCIGNKTENHECSSGSCAVWSHWFEGDCSVSCGNGTMERLRHCSTGRDTDCTGVAYENVPCSISECI